MQQPVLAIEPPRQRSAMSGRRARRRHLDGRGGEQRRGRDDEALGAANAADQAAVLLAVITWMQLNLPMAIASPQRAAVVLLLVVPMVFPLLVVRAIVVVAASQDVRYDAALRRLRRLRLRRLRLRRSRGSLLRLAREALWMRMILLRIARQMLAAPLAGLATHLLDHATVLRALLRPIAGRVPTVAASGHASGRPSFTPLVELRVAVLFGLRLRRQRRGRGPCRG
mmetsp:Transcript_2679/g.7693  ORF Transcript_2679/g.7693 Transcript_2679/m.7693 type:complete len:226 (-) Transcript_2679:488-1165(-)